MRVAIDAMGGDKAPGVIVEGARLAAAEWPDTEIVLVGDTERLNPLLAGKPANISVHHAPDVIGPEDEPVKAVRRKKDSSMVVAGRLLKEKNVDAMISAGNTGALMVTGLLVVGRMEGVERPGLAQVMPTIDGVGLLALDLGANPDASPENLLKYAVMGSVLRTRLNGMERPRIGLLNVGTEEGKGNETAKQAYDLLKQAPLEFVGNVEARDAFKRVCDVLVCDGFSGNVMLKAIEGTAETIFYELRAAFTSNMMSKLAAAVLKPALRKFKKKMDYSEYGGAVLLGISGLVLKAHGSSDANAIKNAVRQARNAHQNGLIPAIESEIGSGKWEGTK